MIPAVGYYVHHHGRGHLSRAQAIVQHMSAEVTVFTSLDARVPGAALVRLPPDTATRSPDLPVPRGLHYSPVCCAGLTERMAIMARWAANTKASLMVVDVSVEVTTFARLCGLPVVAVRQHGRRNDPAHLLAYDCAVSLLAPFHPSLEDPSVTDAVCKKTTYSGGISRYEGRVAPTPLPGPGFDRRGGGHVVVLGGAGGEGWDLDAVNHAADCADLWEWTVLGPARGAPSERVRHIGWLDDSFDLISSADVVIASAGDATVNEVMSAGRPLVCIPEPRPFEEQVSKARRLHEIGAAISFETWPEAPMWPLILQEALGLDCSIHRTLSDGLGAWRAAAHFDDLAWRFGDTRRLDLDLAGSTEDLNAASIGTPRYETHLGEGK